MSLVVSKVIALALGGKLDSRIVAEGLAIPWMLSLPKATTYIGCRYI